MNHCFIYAQNVEIWVKIRPRALASACTMRIVHQAGQYIVDNSMVILSYFIIRRRRRQEEGTQLTPNIKKQLHSQTPLAHKKKTSFMYTLGRKETEMELCK